MCYGIPRELVGAYIVLKKTYPSGIAEDDYIPLIILMSEEISHRGISTVLSNICGKTYSAVYNDVLGAVETRHNAIRVEDIRQHLKRSGYNEWLQEE